MPQISRHLRVHDDIHSQIRAEQVVDIAVSRSQIGVPSCVHEGVPRRLAVSPGFRLRPSLSVVRIVAIEIPPLVSPGFRLRPSLSAPASAEKEGPQPVSPGFRLRPSLSDQIPGLAVRRQARVAGVSAPAFVERRSARQNCSSSIARVAGVSAPAFVERSTRRHRTYTPTRVAGVSAPAFVERARSGLWSCGRRVCGRTIRREARPHGTTYRFERGSGGWDPWDSVTPCAKGDHRGDGSGGRRNLTHVISYAYMRYYGGLDPAPGFLAAAGRPGQRQAAQVRAVARRLCLPCPGRGWRPARLRAGAPQAQSRVERTRSGIVYTLFDRSSSAAPSRP